MLVAMVLPALLAAVMLGADFAVMYYNWMLLQKAADSSALAGASYLPGSNAKVMLIATTYANSNAVSAGAGDTISVTIDGAPTPQWVQVDLTRSVPYFFGKIVGLRKATIKASARAGNVVTCSTAGSSHLLPIGIDCTSGDCYKLGQVITLNAQQLGPGDWGPLSLPGMSGVSNMENVTHYGWTSSNPSDVNQILTVNSGGGCATGGPGCVLMQPGMGSTQKVLLGVTDRINDSNSLNLGDTWQNPNPADPRVVEMPMVDYTKVQGASTMAPITGFAEVWLVGSDNQNRFQVIFIKAVSPGNFPGGTCTDFGSYKTIMLK
jgi:Putative Tad-like Flp pilus-assembly